MRAYRFRPSPALMILLMLVPAVCLGISIPDTITLNDKGTLYEPFPFNHAKHVRDAKECSDCHHHTTGTLVEDPNCVRCHRNSGEAKTVTCRGCHSRSPFSVASLKELSSNEKIYHRDKPGLKGAMHQACIGCHSKQAAGPVGCEDCHTRKKAGHALYNSGEFTPKTRTATGHGH
ncbi:hypothetical protein GSbR_40380 [Geobacter sp. SVR]|nr:hypothetical protein GSVR_27010 [Geobacter sp. SVR]GCF87438.1 hypothetical protein GSbR_40380 [Geobacter sp. SVR]